LLLRERKSFLKNTVKGGAKKKTRFFFFSPNFGVLKKKKKGMGCYSGGANKEIPIFFNFPFWVFKKPKKFLNFGKTKGKKTFKCWENNPQKKLLLF